MLQEGDAIPELQAETKCSLLASGLVCQQHIQPQGSRHESEERPSEKYLRRFCPPLCEPQTTSSVRFCMRWEEISKTLNQPPQTLRLSELQTHPQCGLP